MNQEQVSTSHLGYLCAGRKVAVVRDVTSDTFEVQHMGILSQGPLAGRSAFQPMHEGPIVREESSMGTFGLCDFSALTQPGIYRVVLRESGVCSFQFAIADGAYHQLPCLFLDFMHEWRAGHFASDLHRPGHLDDGVRSDDGAPWDAVGGWYDAGDLRKWMGHSTLPALALLEIDEQLGLPRQHFHEADALPSDWLTEAAWGLRFIFKMQDPQTGMIYEDVGGGSTARWREGMSWWYENHAGCYADNADNRFTDNLPGTGDERRVRIQYNPIAQYTNLTILARAARAYAPHHAELAAQSYAVMLALWRFCETRLEDEEHTWTSVRAWRLIALLELFQMGYCGVEAVDAALAALLQNWDEALGFWQRSASEAEPYRGILHSAQPLIALAKTLELLPDHPQAARIVAVMQRCKVAYIDPMTQTNPYRFMPFGLYSQPMTEGDTYRPFAAGRLVRFCMPVHHPQQINHGLSGHWMSWAHALAYGGQVLGDASWTALAWAQIEWLLGNNPYDVSFVSGVGYNNPMPHSRYLGTVIGGFMNGFRGTPEDWPYVDLAREAEWNSTEYWNVPLSNSLMALARLLPRRIADVRKLGA